MIKINNVSEDEEIVEFNWYPKDRPDVIFEVVTQKVKAKKVGHKSSDWLILDEWGGSLEIDFSKDNSEIIDKLNSLGTVNPATSEEIENALEKING